MHRQEVTKKFWENERHKYDLYISDLVKRECGRGDPEAAKRRLDFIETIPCWQIDKNIEDLGEEYYKILSIPERAKDDCYHLAVCVIKEVDILLSWNLKHLGDQKVPIIREYNLKHGLKIPELRNPETIINLSGGIMEVKEDIYSMDSIDNDPVIQEVRRIKAEIMEEFGYDLRKLGAHLRAMQSEEMARGVIYA
jgi:hypothetical protein